MVCDFLLYCNDELSSSTLSNTAISPSSPQASPALPCQRCAAAQQTEGPKCKFYDHLESDAGVIICAMQLFVELEAVIKRMLDGLATTPVDIIAKVERVLLIWKEREVITVSEFSALKAALSR